MAPTVGEGSGELVYRAYQLGEDGHIRTFVVITAMSEEDALNQARQLADGHTIELWDRERLIARIEPS